MVVLYNAVFWNIEDAAREMWHQIRLHSPGNPNVYRLRALVF